MLTVDSNVQKACEDIMRLVSKVAGLKLAQVIQFLAQEQNEEIARLKAALVASRSSLIASGFVAKGDHGAGDPEINLIDAVLNP